MGGSAHPASQRRIQKSIRRIFLFCAVFTQRTPHESHSYTTRMQPGNYLTPETRNVKSTRLATTTELTFTDATTREKLPEASPKGPGPTHIRALAGQRSIHTERPLVLQGLASRSPQLEKKTPTRKQSPQYHRTKNSTPDIHPY